MYDPVRKPWPLGHGSSDKICYMKWFVIATANIVVRGAVRASRPYLELTLCTPLKEDAIKRLRIPSSTRLQCTEMWPSSTGPPTSVTPLRISGELKVSSEFPQPRKELQCEDLSTMADH